MRLLVGFRALLLAVTAVLMVWSAPSTTVQSMSQGWFRKKLRSVRDRLGWLRNRKEIPNIEIGRVTTLEELAKRLAAFGFKGLGATELFNIFTDLKGCFKTFGPPPGLALDFSPPGADSPDDAVRNFFIFTPPENLTLGSAAPQQPLIEGLQPQSSTEGLQAAVKTLPSTALLEMAPADVFQGGEDRENVEEGAGGETPENNVQQDTQPLRTVKASADPVHVLAHIISKTYQHLNGTSCAETAKNREGLISRVLLGKHSVRYIMEALLVFALVQGNAQSAVRFPRPPPDVRMAEGVAEFNVQRFPANLSSVEGMYDPSMLVAFYDLVKAGESKQLKTLEKSLRRASNEHERSVAESLFAGVLSDPDKHTQIGAIGRAVGTDEERLVRTVENIAVMAMYTGETVSILLPNLPRVASFVRGISFFAFEGSFKQHGHYVMPNLPCGGNLTGSMLETLTGKKLGAKYFVYKHTLPVREGQMPVEVWAINRDSDIGQYYTKLENPETRQLLGYLPRVCISEALYKKCLKEPITYAENTSPEEILCEFIHNHPKMFFEVDGEAVYAMREEMGKNFQSTGLFARAGRSLSRGWRALRRAFFSKTFLAFLLGGFVGVLLADSPFRTKASVPLALKAFLSTEFKRSLDLTGKLLGIETTRL